MIDQLLDDLEGVGDVAVEMLVEDRMLRHAIERVLSQVVELAVAVNSHVAATRLEEAPKDYRDSFRLAQKAGLLDVELSARLQPSVGLRNVLAHEYVEVDLEIVARATDTALTDYREYVRCVSAWLGRV